jgi:Flp pilus assembly pilin Flp
VTQKKGKTKMRFLKCLRRNVSGNNLVEYALILGLISLVAVAATPVTLFTNILFDKLTSYTSAATLP